MQNLRASRTSFGPSHAAPSRRGAALMLSMLVMMVLVLVVWQIGIGTRTQYQVSRNDVSLTQMDLAIESALLEVFEQLKADGEADGEGGGAAAGGSPDLAGALGGAGLGAGGEQGEGAAAAGPADSRRDEWARPQRSEVGEIQLRVLVQDENSKLNVLAMLSEDFEEAEKAFQRVVRVIDLFREGTSSDVPTFEAEALATTLREHLVERDDSALPRTPLVMDDPDEANRGMPLTLEEVVVLAPFERGLFQDFRDEDDRVVHSLSSFLTISSSMQARADAEQGDTPAGGVTGGGDAAQGGGAGSELSIGGAAGSEVGLNPATGGAGGLGGDQGDVATDRSSDFSSGVQGGDNGTYALPGAVNLNTAPPVVLKALFDSRDVDPRFFDDVIEYRNEEDEEATEDDEDPILDEFGEELVLNQFFTTADDLPKLDGWAQIDPLVQAEVAQLVGTRSNVFSIYVTARRSTAADQDLGGAIRSREEQERYEESGKHLTRTVRCLVWRRSTEEGVELIPLERWEVMDYSPYEVLDFPDEDR